MAESAITTASYLRRRAALYRDLARRAIASGIAREFYALAHDYDNDAARLEARGDDEPRVRRTGTRKRRNATALTPRPAERSRRAPAR